MRLRRAIGITFAVLGLLILPALLYLAFGDLGRHKKTIENFVSRHTGREFVIEGPLKIEVVPVIKVFAERVRFANSPWGSKPQMVQVGRLSAEVGFWSLFSGPVDIRSFELRDVTVLLEKRRDGQANWMFTQTPAPEDKDETDAEPKTRTEFPLVIQNARLENVQLTYRASGRSDQVARLESLTITPGKAGLLGLDGSGVFDDYPISLKGEAGPVASLLAGRDIRMNLEGHLGRLALDIEGGFASLDPLDGANLRIKASGADFDRILARLNLPVFASGTLAVDAQLSDLDKGTRFTVSSSFGDLQAKASGRLQGLYLRGSDITFEATAADAARLAGVFGVKGVPAAPLAVGGRIEISRKELQFEKLKAHLAGVTTELSGAWKRGRKQELALGFDLAVADLHALRAALPATSVTAKGKLRLDAERFEIRELEASLGANPLSGSFTLVRGDPLHIEADLASSRLDLTPYLASQQEAGQTAAPSKDQKKKAKGAEPAKPRYLFSETPMPMRQLSGTQARLHLAIAELALANKVFQDVDSTVVLEGGQVQLQARAHGSLGGTASTSLTLEPGETGGARADLKFQLDQVRAGLDTADMRPEEVPPLGVALELTTHGASPREMAIHSNGHVLLTQGAGKTRAQFLNAFGGDVLAQLRTKLNPFRSQDPFTQLDCTVVRADIVDGAVTVMPVLVQTQKVTVAAKGKIDLRSEELTFDFNTRPRKGIGVSPGMFTNPFIRLQGTLMNPRIAVGAKGVSSGAVAAATGGLSVLAGGFIDRIKGEADLCRKTLEQANGQQH